ncbi:MAG: hypothetical protein B1H07_00575 [Campylobacteraceae bacterium 4484_166]|nr:MAG: hypothetical protein B1H07_00575 [Campylobacteraceae bacterium 4484_166]
MLKRLTIASLISILFISCAGMDPQGRGVSMVIPLGSINATLNQKFPMDKKVGEGFFSGLLNISNPTVLGKSGKDKLDIGSSFKFTNSLLPDGLNGAVSLASGVRYDKATKSLYLKDPEVQELKIQNFTLSKFVTKDTRELITSMIVKVLKKEKIYTLSEKDISTGFVKAVDVRNGQVYLTFGL